MKQAVVYPRGFMGFDIGLPVHKETPDIKKLVSAVRYNKYQGAANKATISNNVIFALHQRSIFGSIDLDLPVFREKVIQAALGAFGTQSFLDWAELQLKSPYLSDLHVRFLNDTFEFIQTGKRAVSVHNWDSLLTPQAASIPTRSTPYKYMEYCRMQQVLPYRNPATVSGTVLNWLCQPEGFTDMLNSLYILFCNTKQANS